MIGSKGNEENKSGKIKSLNDVAHTAHIVGNGDHNITRFD